MSTPAKQCARCTAEILPNVTDGFCAACLLESGLGAAEDKSPSDELPTGQHRAQFPQDFGEHELIAEIARGGQGVVYRARHIALKREVALKMFPHSPWTTATDLERFRREARLAADLDHPAIVPIFEVGEFHGQHFFTMKLVDGVGLDRLASTKPFAPRRAAEIVAEAACAIQHAHERGVLHRDIKPGNILLDSAGHPHLTDFGIAKLLAADSALTRTRDILGTPSYISPECVAGGAAKLSAATDVYGLGAVLYFLLTGHPPFAGGTTLQTIRDVAEKEPQRPRLWNPKVDRDLETICLKCLEKNSGRRYATAAGLADDLQRWGRHQPILARPGSVAYRGRKWLRRNAVAASLSAVAVIGATAIGWSVNHARRSSVAPPTLAVLLHSADAESRYLTAEFSRNLIHALGNLPGTRVAPRADVLKWEGTAVPPLRVGKSLRVPALVVGTVKQSATGIQVRFELLDVAAGRTLWSKSHEVPLSSGAEVQTQVARAVASQLGLELTGRNRRELRSTLTANPEAWAHYLRGRQLLDSQSESNLLQAVTAFEQAIARDGTFAQAYAGLADAHLGLGYTFREPAVHFAKARESVREALKRDETLPDALVADGVLKYFLEWDWSAAESSVKQAVLLDSSKLENHACYLHCLETVGRVEEALKIVRAAADSHPSSIMIQAELGCASYYAGQFAEAETYWREILKKDPENVYLQWGLARTLAQRNQLHEAARELEAALAKPDGAWAAVLAELAYVRGRQDRRTDALRLIDELRGRATREFVDPYLFAMAQAGLSDHDEVFRQLALAAQSRSSWIPSLPVDPKFSALRKDPRYLGLMATLKLPVK